jgi:succinate dehydrogenase / fumarate reductase membrane anchor subunit
MRLVNPRCTRSDRSAAPGLESAKTGVAHWWLQRATAVALIPLTTWFAAMLLAVTRRGHDALIAWLRSPFAAILMVLLLLAVFYHMALGLQVVIEDYVHSSRVKLLAVFAVRLGCSALAVAGMLSVLRIAFSGLSP